MRVVITGGTGLIGRALAADLVADHPVFVLSRHPQRASHLPAGVQVVGWDGRTAEGWGHLADGAWAIVNLAGESIAGEKFLPARWTAERKRRLRDSRLQAGQAVMAAVEAAAQKPVVVVQASAIGYYGPRQAEVIDETAAAGQDFLARLAVEWEASTAAVEHKGVRRVIIRTGVVLARQGGALPRLLLPYRLFAGGPMGNGRQYYAWIHLADEVRAIRALLENQLAAGPFNLVAPHPLPNREFGQVLGRVLGRPSLLPVPGPMMRLAFGEVATVVLDGQRVIPRRLQEMGFPFRFPDLQAALRDLL
ncbi:MAG: TIGR01777 family oxidoreductase [Chloroflexota bacterium]